MSSQASAALWRPHWILSRPMFEGGDQVSKDLQSPFSYR